jgi:hypothetical protein
MRSRRHHRTLLAFDELAYPDGRESDISSHLIRNSLDLNGLTNLCSTNICNMDVDACS